MCNDDLYKSILEANDSEIKDRSCKFINEIVLLRLSLIKKIGYLRSINPSQVNSLRIRHYNLIKSDIKQIFNLSCDDYFSNVSTDQDNTLLNYYNDSSIPLTAKEGI